MIPISISILNGRSDSRRRRFGFWPLDFNSTLVVEAIIVVLLYRTVRDYAEVAKLSRVEVKQRFRPWIGPSTGKVEFVSSTDGKEQYSIAIKNFGEIAATNVVAMSNKGNRCLQRETYALGPRMIAAASSTSLLLDRSCLIWRSITGFLLIQLYYKR